MNAAMTHPLGEDLNDCTGCAACAAACPKGAISMSPSAEGFLYPQINVAACNDCDICRNTCPVKQKGLREDAEAEGIKELKREKPLKVFAAWHIDEAIRRESSSGGVFTALAERILAQGGVVVGAAFDDNFVVRHILIENSTDLQRLRGSKYVQSEISPALYLQIRDLLKRGKSVFFSGTPCQVAAIRNFLHKPYDNFFCCDIVCHGVPSPILFAHYLQYNLIKGEQVVKISFRNKAKGWKNYGVFRYLYNGDGKFITASADSYMLAFLRNYALRLSCYLCKFTTANSRPGDLTIADFWGVAKKYPEYDHDDKGTSLVLVNTKKGKSWLCACSQHLFLGTADLDTAIAGNPSIVRPSHRPPERDTFYRDLDLLPFPAIIRKYRLHTPSLPRRLVISLKRRAIGIILLLIRRKPKVE